MAPRLSSFLRRIEPAACLALALALAAGCDEGAGLVVLDAQGTALVPDLSQPGELGARAAFHDFGHVPLGEKVEHTIALRNTDPLEVRVERVDPSCGCSEVRVRAIRPDGTAVDGIVTRTGDVARVEPGGRLELTVRMDSREVADKNRDKLVTVRMVTSSPHRPYLTFEYHLIVDAELQIVPAAIDLGRVARNVGGHGKTEIVPVGESGTRPTGLGPLPEGVRAELRAEQRGRGPVWVLEADLQPPIPAGRSERKLVVLTERADPAAGGASTPGRTFPVVLTALGVEDVELLPAQVAISAARGAVGTAEAVLRSNLPGHAFGVTGYELDERARGWVTLAFEPVEPGAGGKSARWNVKLEARPGEAQAAVAGTGAVLLDDPQYPRVEFRYVVRVP